MANVLVTGGAGFVGSHICKALSVAGNAPITLDNLSRGHREFVRWGPLVEADVTDRSALDSVMTDHAVDAVIHCAALAYVDESWERPLDYYRTNVIGSMTVLEAMRAANIDHFVFSSSCAVYGEPTAVPIGENAPIAPISPYGRTKSVVETIAMECSRAYGIKTIALRYFNAAGADPDGEIGERHDPETHLIPTVLMAAADLSRVIPINGTDYPTPDGTAVRDYIHVTDLADAHVRALDYSQGTDGYHVFNLGAGQGVSVREVISTAERVTGKIVRTEDVARRPGDPDRLIADAQKAQEVLGWSPLQSDLENIVVSARDYLAKDS